MNDFEIIVRAARAAASKYGGTTRRLMEEFADQLEKLKNEQAQLQRPLSDDEIPF